jgi:hypothetical protein
MSDLLKDAAILLLCIFCLIQIYINYFLIKAVNALRNLT